MKVVLKKVLYIKIHCHFKNSQKTMNIVQIYNIISQKFKRLLVQNLEYKFNICQVINPMRNVTISSFNFAYMHISISIVDLNSKRTFQFKVRTRNTPQAE